MEAPFLTHFSNGNQIGHKEENPLSKKVFTLTQLDVKAQMPILDIMKIKYSLC